MLSRIMQPRYRVSGFSDIILSAYGVLAHLVERDIRIVEASGSSPLHSTNKGY